MTEAVTILPIAPEHLGIMAAVIGVLILSALIYGALAMTARSYRRPVWEDIPEGWRSLAIVMALLWIGLFGLTVIAAYSGVWQMIHPKDGQAGASLGLGALLAAMLGAPFVIWGTVLKHRTVTFQKEGHITDRINTAVEMLGAEKTVKTLKEDGSGSVEVTVPNIEVRIGAILSLERIAQDSTAYDKGRDHVRVMEILCAYVRENSKARKAEDFPEEEWVPLKDGASEVERAAHLAKRRKRFDEVMFESKARAWAQTLPPPRADIATALTVLGRRTHAQRRVEAAWPNPPTEATVWPFDLSCPELPEKPKGVAQTEREIAAFMDNLEAWKDSLHGYSGYRLDLRGINLQSADLSYAVLSGARMEGARMEGARLFATQMKGAYLRDARMEGAIIDRARMEGARLTSARMEGARLDEAGMAGASLTAARMEGASLSGARMEATRLNGARMEAARLNGARMEGAKFEWTRMEGAELRKAHLDAALNLTTAKLHGSSVWGVDFTSVQLSQRQIDQVFGDGSVMLSKGVTRPAHWPDWEMDVVEFYAEWRKWQADPGNYTPPPKPE